MSYVFIGALVAVVVALLYVSMKREKRPNPYADIASRPVIPTVIIDIDMPFGSLVLFLSKLALASIPALIIVFAVLATLFTLFTFTGISGAIRWF